jgi:hypothetical protein
MPDPLEDDDIFGLPEDDEDKSRPSKEEGEGKERGVAAGKPGGVPGDDPDDEVSPQDQLGMARRHNRRIEKRLGQQARENLELKQRLQELEETQARLVRSSLHSDLRSVQGSVAAAEQALITARDDGNRQAELAAERTLATERGRLATLERAVSSAAEQREPAPPPPVRDTRLEVAKELADEWSRKHSWYGAGDASEDSEIVRAVSVAIVNDRDNPIDIDDPEHFAELDRRLARRLPERYPRRQPPPRRDEAEMDDNRPDVSGTRGTSRRAPVSSGNGAGELPSSLTQQQIRAYEAMGLKWNDKDTQEKIIAMEKQLVEERKGRYSRG